MSWLLVGVALLIGGLIWLLALTQVIVAPVITAAIVAAVASPLVAWLNAPPRPARARGGADPARDRRDRRRDRADGRQRDHRRERRHRRPARRRQGHDRAAGSRTSASTRARPTSAKADAPQRDQRQRSTPCSTGSRRRREALLARLLPRDDHAQPLLPAQGRARRSGPGPSATSGVPRPVARTITAARPRRRCAATSSGSRSSPRSTRSWSRSAPDPRRAADRDDRRGHLHRRLHPLPRRLERPRSSRS